MTRSAGHCLHAWTRTPAALPSAAMLQTAMPCGWPGWRHARTGLRCNCTGRSARSRCPRRCSGNSMPRTWRWRSRCCWPSTWMHRRRQARCRAYRPRRGGWKPSPTGPATCWRWSTTPIRPTRWPRRCLRCDITAAAGCGGERDRGKRPDMGRVAERLADKLVITDDNPRGEDGRAIVADILAGIDDVGAVRIERDRHAAIHQALGAAQPGDVVLIAGKGHEDVQLVAGERRPFSDRALAASWTGGVL